MTPVRLLLSCASEQGNEWFQAVCLLFSCSVPNPGLGWSSRSRSSELTSGRNPPWCQSVQSDAETGKFIKSSGEM